MELSPSTRPVIGPSTAREGARLRVRLATSTSDLHAVLRLRQRVFRAHLPSADAGEDADDFDPACRHLLVERRADGLLLGCLRLLHLPDGGGIGRSYAALRYDLHRLARYPRPMTELGRFCMAPGLRDPDAVRLIWAALAEIVQRRRIGMLFGCTSLAGADPLRHRRALAFLARHHAAPLRWRPEKRQGVSNHELPAAKPDDRRARGQLPTLLRSYLALGAWVSGHAVADHDLNTLHLFTALETAAVPSARRRFLYRGRVLEH